MPAHIRLAIAILILASAALASAADIEVAGDCTLAHAINAANLDEAVGSCPARRWRGHDQPVRFH